MTSDPTTAIRPRSWSPAANGPAKSIELSELRAPQETAAILAGLEGHVVGQRRALAELSLLLSMHALMPAGRRSPNAIVVGPTGVGKSHSLAVASGLMGLPFVATDATSLVPSGIVGEQVEDVLEALVDAADALLSASDGRRRRDDDLELAQRGILLIDEFDKLAAPDDGTSWGRVEKRVIQRRLLKLAEGARLRVGVKHHVDDRRERFIDTAGVLLLVSGAFSDLPTLGPWSLARVRRDGRRITSADIIAAGFIPELVGRLPILIAFEALSARELVGIIEHDGVSPLVVWRHYLDLALDADLELDEAAKWVVAERAAALGLGARGLQQVLFPVLASRAGELARSDTRQVLTLRAADFIPESAATPMALPVQ